MESSLPPEAERLYERAKTHPTPSNVLEAVNAQLNFAKTLKITDIDTAFLLAERLRELGE